MRRVFALRQRILGSLASAFQPPSVCNIMRSLLDYDISIPSYLYLSSINDFVDKDIYTTMKRRRPKKKEEDCSAAKRSKSPDHSPEPCATALTKESLQRLERMTSCLAPSAFSIVASNLTGKSARTTITTTGRGQASKHNSGATRSLSTRTLLHRLMLNLLGSFWICEAEWKEYRWAVEAANNEYTVMVESMQLFKTFGVKDYRKSYCQQFDRVSRDLGFDNNLCQPTPDLVEGFTCAGFSPYDLENIQDAIMSSEHKSMALPHFVGEWKKKLDGDIGTAIRQVAYDAAFLVHGIARAHAVIANKSKTEDDKKAFEQEEDTRKRKRGRQVIGPEAKVLSFAMCGSTMAMFSNHATGKQPDKRICHQVKLRTFSDMDLDYDTWLKARWWLRNAQDYTRKQAILS